MLRHFHKLVRKILFVLLVSTLSSCWLFYQPTLDIQGHRGARGLFPENTLIGFRKTIEMGVTTLELDLGLTKDLVPVVSHDPYLNQNLCLDANGDSIATDTLGYGPLISNLTLKEIKTFDCGSLNPDVLRFPQPPRKNIPGEKIPTLQEVFDLLAEYPNNNIWLNIEIKIVPKSQVTTPVDGFVKAVVQVINQNNAAGKVNIQSFDWQVLESVKIQAPYIKTAALLGQSTFKSINDSVPSPWLNGIHFENSGGTALAILHEAQNYVDIFSPSWRLIMPKDSLFLGNTVNELKNNGFPVIPWTINRTKTMEKVILLGVDGIITDYPDSLLMVMKKMGIKKR
jgi:glycerophosphoryl diester phosphodiesterase